MPGGCRPEPLGPSPVAPRRRLILPGGSRGTDFHVSGERGPAHLLATTPHNAPGGRGSPCLGGRHVLWREPELSPQSYRGRRSQGGDRSQPCGWEVVGLGQDPTMESWRFDREERPCAQTHTSLLLPWGLCRREATSRGEAESAHLQHRELKLPPLPHSAGCRLPAFGLRSDSRGARPLGNSGARGPFTVPSFFLHFAANGAAVCPFCAASSHPGSPT